MSVISRIRRGWHLGFQSLRVVFRDKTLLLFPLIPITLALAIVTAFYVIVGPDKILFFLNTQRNERGVQLINWGYYENVLIAYALIALISVFFSFGLTACTRITLYERDSNFSDGMKAALMNFHWVILWAFISWTIGPIFNLLDHQRHSSRWVRKILGSSWSLLSYFVLPILVVDRINIFSALRRSSYVMSEKWGEGAVSRLGLMWFFWFMNIPTMALFAYGHYLEGPWPRPLTFVVVLMLYFTIVIYQTASSVLSVVLYKYANDGSVVKGFKEKWMEHAFRKPRIYVLVDEEPQKGYAPADGEPERAGDAPENDEPATGEPLTDGPLKDTPPANDGVEDIPPPTDVEPMEDTPQPDAVPTKEIPVPTGIESMEDTPPPDADPTKEIPPPTAVEPMDDGPKASAPADDENATTRDTGHM